MKPTDHLVETHSGVAIHLDASGTFYCAIPGRPTREQLTEIRRLYSENGYLNGFTVGFLLAEVDALTDALNDLEDWMEDHGDGAPDSSYLSRELLFRAERIRRLLGR